MNRQTDGCYEFYEVAQKVINENNDRLANQQNLKLKSTLNAVSHSNSKIDTLHNTL